MAEEIVNKLIILEFVNDENTQKMAKKMGIFRKKMFFNLLVSK